MGILPSALAAALLIGLSLGLLGGGGSVLTVPVFVYLLGIPAKSAVAMSMPVVGITSLVGAVSHWRAGNVEWRSALVFGGVAMIGAFAGARLSAFVSGTQQLLFLATIMIAASASMFRRGPTNAVPTMPKAEPAIRPIFLITALGVGIVTGLVGIGGGFLVVPALILLGNVPMARAIGTSLVVIAMNAASGLLGYSGQVAIDWKTVTWFTAVTIVGILVGSRWSSRVSPSALRRGFALFLVLIAVFMLWQNLINLT